MSVFDELVGQDDVITQLGYALDNPAAKARAAFDRPDPGGPVNSHARVIAAGVSSA